MKVLKICINEWENASRDKRELSVCRELGADVIVVAKGQITGVEDVVDGFQVMRLSTRPLGAKVPAAVNRLISIINWISYVRKIPDIDIISGHDYIALLIGYLSNIGKRKKAKLVYDSHEFEIGRNTVRGFFSALGVCWVERFLMERCAFSIVVNDIIADEVKRIHNLEKRPVVVRNIPNYWELDHDIILRTRKELMESIATAEDAFLLMYHGAVTNDRGIEQLIEVVKRTNDIVGCILGDGNPSYIAEIRKQCELLGLQKRIIFHHAVPHSELWKYVAAADAGLITVQATFKSYYYMLPNKFFENIQCLTPVIVSDFPAVGELVDKYGVGIKVNPANIDAITAAVCELRSNQQLQRKLQNNLYLAKQELCWEKEKMILEDAYAAIM